MSAQIISLRSRVPSDLYEMIPRFMNGELISLQVTALSSAREIKHYSFGRTPKCLAVIADNEPSDIFG